VMCMTMVIYAFAVANTFLYLCTYRVSGQRHGRWIPTWLSLTRMEYIACFSCLSLVLLNICGFALHPDALFVAPVFIGIATLVAILSQLLTTLSKSRSLTGPFNQWQKRTMTAKAVGVTVAFTYMAGFCNSIILCSVARIWPTSLQSQGLLIFIWGSLMHLLLSAGYGASIWVHLHLMRLRAVRHAHNTGAISQITAAPRSPEGPTDAEQAINHPAMPSATSVPAVQPSSGPQEDIECIVCMDELRNTVLVPCGHIALCNTCAMNIMTSRRPLCPICNSTVDDLCRVYRA